MKKITYLVGVVALLICQLAQANTIIASGSGEPALVGAGGILDNEFGLDGLQRIDDERDQFWTILADEVAVSVVAKHAGFSQNFGFIDGNDDFTSLLYVNHAMGQEATFSISDAGSPFRFGLDPSGSPLFSSAAEDNIFCGWYHCSGPYDHMVSWLITDGEFAGDYVIAWEDMKRLGDHDYNDLVIRVSGVSAVPVPSALWLFGSGILGLVAVVRRFN